MANLLGGFSAVVRWNKDVSYSQIEGALIGVGFTDYLIDRGVIGSETTATISVHVPMELITAEGTPDLDAVNVLRSIADAIADIDKS
jgi:hypothetical protein